MEVDVQLKLVQLVKKTPLFGMVVVAAAMAAIPANMVVEARLGRIFMVITRRLLVV